MKTVITTDCELYLILAVGKFFERLLVLFRCDAMYSVVQNRPSFPFLIKKYLQILGLKLVVYWRFMFKCA